MSEPRRWTVDIYEQGSRREVTLRDQNWDHTLEIDNDGDLRVEFDVDSESYGGGTRTVRAYFPMAKVIEFLRAATTYWGVVEAHAPTDADRPR